MRTILNVIWLVLCGFWMAIAYALAGLACFALFFLVVTIPFGIAAFRIAGYVLWPFGRTIEPRRDAGLGSMIGNIIWIVAVRLVAGAGPPGHRDRAVHHDYRHPARPREF